MGVSDTGRASSGYSLGWGVQDPKPPPLLVDASTQSDDVALVADARRDRRAFGALYDRYAERVYSYCLHRLDSREAAEDATSLIFTRAIAGLHRFQGGSFAAWLFAIAHNTVANVYRERRPEAPLEAIGEIASPSSSPEDLALGRDDQRLVRELLGSLPADQRRVIELRLAGLTGAEIAEALGRSLASIKMLQARALARMRARTATHERERDGCA
jgi:RNA polymerase sigma factor (sigma-70 family)